MWKDNPEALKLARLEFKTTVLKESVRVHPPPLIDPSLCDKQGNEEDSMSNSDHNFYENQINCCEGAAFARQCIGLSLRYVWEQLAAVLNAYERCLHAHADSRLKIDGKHAETPHENDAYAAGMAARAAQANRQEPTNDGPADAASDSERKHGKRREAAQAAEPATARGTKRRMSTERVLKAVCWLARVLGWGVHL